MVTIQRALGAVFRFRNLLDFSGASQEPLALKPEEARPHPHEHLALLCLYAKVCFDFAENYVACFAFKDLKYNILYITREKLRVEDSPAGVERNVFLSCHLTCHVHEHATSFSDDDASPRHVPAVDAHFVVGVCCPTGHQAHVDRGGSDASDPKGQRLKVRPEKEFLQVRPPSLAACGSL